jgi:mRNA interferase RelE/StbE
MYELIIDDKATEFLEKLEKSLAQRIFKKIQSTKENPFHFFERLEGRTDFKLRVGDYRVIADIDTSKQRIEVTEIGHRKNIYKRI